jgi:hypothetical protein
METITFTATVGDDRVIRLPEGVQAPPGPVQVTLTSLTGNERAAQEPEGGAPTSVRGLIEFARQHYVAGSLPPDLAENHDHYLHGLPKGIDRP